MSHAAKYHNKIYFNPFNLLYLVYVLKLTVFQIPKNITNNKYISDIFIV